MSPTRPLHIAVASTPLFAQGTTQAILEKPPANTWPGYHGDYSGQRHSQLKQITPENVDKLGLAWIFPTGQGATIKSSPLVVDGVIYITVPDRIWAVDARSGHQIWSYTYPPNKGLHIGHRGVSMYRDWLFFLSPDGHLVSLDSKTGKERWNVEVADVKRGYWTTMSPLVVRENVIIGVSGDFDNLRGYLRSIDPENGKTKWTWYSTPPEGTPRGHHGRHDVDDRDLRPGAESALLGYGQPHRRPEREISPR